jgi:hypothetical protein
MGWQALGDGGFERRVDTLFDLARYMAGKIKERVVDGFVLTSDPSCTNVCFFHIPAYLRTDPIAAEVLKGNFDALQAEGTVLGLDEHDVFCCIFRMRLNLKPAWFEASMRVI